MPLPMLIQCFLLLAGAIGCAVYYAIVLWRMTAINRSLPTLRDGLALPLPEGAQGGPPGVCVLIPAHNEEDIIEHAVRTLKAQDYPDLRIVFALDRCTDNTEPIVREIAGDDPRFEVFLNDHCPDDWAGKVNVLHQAVRSAEGPRDADLLLFADADTAFDPGCVRAAVALSAERGLDLFSTLPTLRAETWYERIVQPAAGFELVRQYPLDQINKPGRTGKPGNRPFANGQFMLFRREAYEALGGHEAVKDELLEDLAFAKACARAGRSFGCFMADRMLFCRMYRNWPAFGRGWKRIYTESTKRRPDRLFKWAWRLRVTGTLLPILALAALLVSPLAWGADRPLAIAMLSVSLLALALFAFVVTSIQSRQDGARWWGLLHPIGAWLVAGILDAARRDLINGVATTWGGKTYDRPIREKPPSKREARKAAAAAITNHSTEANA